MDIVEHTDTTATAAIREVVARLQHAQQNELVDEFVDLFRPDAIWTTGGGRRLFGRDPIAAFTRQVLPGAMRGSTQTYEIEHVLFLRPDVAAVKVRQQTVGPDGVPVEGARLGSPMYVMTEDEGRWQLAAGQNTLVVDGPGAVDGAALTGRDEAEIRGIVADVEAGFNSNDVELSTRHFADDTLATSAIGAVNRGLPALVEAHRAGLSGPLRDATAHYRVRRHHRDRAGRRGGAEAGVDDGGRRGRRRTGGDGRPLRPRPARGAVADRAEAEHPRRRLTRRCRGFGRLAFVVPAVVVGGMLAPRPARRRRRGGRGPARAEEILERTGWEEPASEMVLVRTPRCPRRSDRPRPRMPCASRPSGWDVPPDRGGTSGGAATVRP
jgi:uncharacterized protein (TIGR02246 family)